MPNHTPATIAKMTEHEDYLGFGYLGHEHRTDATDQALANVANENRIPAADLFAWANSRPARHFMDGENGDWHRPAATLEARLTTELLRELPALRAEAARA